MALLGVRQMSARIGMKQQHHSKCLSSLFDFKISFFCSICLLLRRSGFCHDYGPSLPNASPPLDVAGFLARHTLIGCDIGMSCSFYSVFVLSFFQRIFIGNNRRSCCVGCCRCDWRRESIRQSRIVESLYQSAFVRCIEIAFFKKIQRSFYVLSLFVR